MSDDKLKENDESLPTRRGWNVVNFDVLKNPPEGFAVFVYVASSLVLLTLIGFGLISSFRFAYETLVGDFKDRVEVAKVFFPVIVALIGGPILIWRALTAHWAAQATRHQADTAREAHFTTLFTKAVEQLGATRDTVKVMATLPSEGTPEQRTVAETEPNLEVRLGAIYALERVARDSERDHWPIMEVLSAYVRNPQNCGEAIARPKNVYPSADLFLQGSDAYRAWILSLPPPRVDIQAVITVLARRESARVEREQEQGFSLDFTGANLQCARFRGGSFAGASFVRAYLDNASLRGADLRNTTFIDAHLEEADMVKARLDGSWLGSAVMNRVSLHEASCDHAKFDHANLEGAAFNGARLFHSDFDDARLSGARFNGAILRDVRFRNSIAARANFIDAELKNVDFSGARLFAAQFLDAKFDNALFSESELDGSAFFGSDLSTVADLSKEQISVALGDASTILPSGMARPSEWATKILSSEERSRLFTAALYELRFRI